MEPLKEKEDFFEVICIFQELSTLTGSFCFNFLEVLKSSEASTNEPKMSKLKTLICSISQFYYLKEKTQSTN